MLSFFFFFFLQYSLEASHMHLYIFIYFYGPVRVQSSEAAPSWFASSKRILLTASPCRGTAVLIGAEFEYGRFKKPREKNKPNIEKQ